MRFDTKYGNKVFELASKNGYKPEKTSGKLMPSDLLDPTFFQALGKALGWNEKGYDYLWVNTWHSFIDHLIAKKDPDDFFKTLIESK